MRLAIYGPRISLIDLLEATVLCVGACASKSHFETIVIRCDRERYAQEGTDTVHVIVNVFVAQSASV